jgi:hypothetical protein
MSFTPDPSGEEYVTDGCDPKLSADLLTVVISARLCNLIPLPVNAKNMHIHADVEPISNQSSAHEYTCVYGHPLFEI